MSSVGRGVSRCVCVCACVCVCVCVCVQDERVHEVVRLLRSSRPLRLRVERTPEVSDHEWEQRKQARLTLLCKVTTLHYLSSPFSTVESWEVQGSSDDTHTQ